MAEEGIAHSADRVLLDAVYDMFSVRVHSIGAVTKMLREHHAEDASSATATRKRKNKEKEKAALNKARKRWRMLMRHRALPWLPP